MKNIIVFLFLVLAFSSCGKKYSLINIGQELKSGKTYKEIIQLKDRQQLVAVIETNHGMIEFDLFVNEAPKAVENFVGLSLQGYYNNIIFHRVVKNLLIQGGDSTATGKGGRSIFGTEFENEISYKLRFDSPGIVAMANRGPDTNTSQFFITVSPIPFLDSKHTIFGKVIDGLDVIQEITAVQTDDKEKPIDPIIIKNVTIEKRVFN
jgi:cyclophilin family peptidyl-prolyl cis-trans isomerase